MTSPVQLLCTQLVVLQRLQVRSSLVRVSASTKTAKPSRCQVQTLHLATLGTFILWLGWFGFNGGSQLGCGYCGRHHRRGPYLCQHQHGGGCRCCCSADHDATMMYKKPDLTMVLNGALGRSCVSITASPLEPTLFGSLWIGAVGGIIVVFAVPFFDQAKDR